MMERVREPMSVDSATPASLVRSAWTTVKTVLEPATERVARRLDWRERVHFLHIGKNAGSQIGQVARQINERSDRLRVVVQGHSVRLLDLPEGARYFFSIRDPIRRFVSGFYSRKRRGQPRIHVPWSPHEALAFQRFEHANDLAESLDERGVRRIHAFCAMKSISHVSMDQVGWFDRAGFFLEVRPPVWIVRQEHLAEDLRSLMGRLGCGELPLVLSDSVAAHRNDYSGIPPLSERARTNLTRWYAQDLLLYAACCAWIEEHAGRPR